jgi:hypothetical protein
MPSDGALAEEQQPGVVTLPSLPEVPLCSGPYRKVGQDPMTVEEVNAKLIELAQGGKRKAPATRSTRTHRQPDGCKKKRVT